MLLAKLTALVGLALFVGGALGVLGGHAQAVSAVLLLLAAGIGAVSESFGLVRELVDRGVDSGARRGPLAL